MELVEQDDKHCQSKQSQESRAGDAIKMNMGLYLTSAGWRCRGLQIKQMRKVHLENREAKE